MEVICKRERLIDEGIVASGKMNKWFDWHISKITSNGKLHHYEIDIDGDVEDAEYKTLAEAKDYFKRLKEAWKDY